MVLLKQILISNLIMLIIPFIALKFDLFSNQIELIYQRQIDNSSEFKQSISTTQILELPQIPLHTRYILSHCQFDGIHFLMNKYEYQPNFAFIKAYTTLIDSVNTLVKMVSQRINLVAVFQKLSFFQIKIIFLLLINKIFFSISAIKLQQIAFHLTKNQRKSQLIAKIFLYNPACIFFHSVYTESLYTFLTFSSILQLLESQGKLNENYVKAIGYIFSAVFIRTNGVFLAPIFGMQIIFQLWLSMNEKRWRNSLGLVLKGFMILTLIVSPLLWYQNLTYSQLCDSSIDFQNDGQLQAQCEKTWPNLYNFIQKKFWSVGFFSYWKTSNLVFILIGLPAILLSFNCFKELFEKLTKFQSGDYMQLTKIGLELSFVILYSITVVLTNIQSSTRFFSTHPVFYLILSRKIKQKVVRAWIFFYLTLGSILFCIGFPWT